MTNEVQLQAQEIEREVDLAKDLLGLGNYETADVLIQVMPNPARNKATLWSMEDGSAIKVPMYRVKNMLAKVDEDGNKRFTTHQHEAPTPVLGTYKCFLSATSDERTSGELAKAGITGAVVCKYEHGPSEWAKKEHERIKHKQSTHIWESYQARKREDEFREEQREMQRAMIGLANTAALSREIVDATVANRPSCPDCGWPVPLTSKNPGASLNMHKKHAHSEQPEEPQE